MNKAVVFRNVTKRYKMYKNNSEKFLDLILPKGYGEDFFAVQNINFVAEKGDVIGIIGVNGAGKSTLSNLITGVVPPSEGSVEIKGEASLIAIASGLNSQLTGRNNIELKCLMLGFNKKEIEELMPEIIEFAELGKFIDQPVKKYSSGMKSRLGFAISVNIDPDVLVIDEALSVGDQTFAEKCLNQINSFQERGKTIFFISHSIGQVKKFCKKAIWMEAGEIKAYGSIEEVAPAYEKFLKDYKELTPEAQKNFKQMIMEKRNKLNRAIDDNDGMITRTDVYKKQMKRKAQGKRKRLIASAFLAIGIIAAALLFSQSERLLAIIQKEPNGQDLKILEKPDKHVGSSTDAPIREEKDIRYVNVNAGFVRDNPDLLKSEKISMIIFGDYYIIEEIQKDPVEDFNWLKIMKNEQAVWVSEQILSKDVNTIEEEQLFENISVMFQVDNLEQLLSFIGQSKEESNATDLNEIVKFAYTDDEHIKGISIDTNHQSRSIEEMIELFGTPSIQLVHKAILYHGEKYDAIFYFNDRGLLREIFIK
ncbi:teichoic acids export ABC transporter ATP-binding subunit TagH [Peribacillus butanolivorans]|uniref:teichoic acids export ABC transporter ATP-binding subunit TagH n=1 Tax=Peribacillus butanolivorans TaxID=421767 RepID=UPI0036D8585F